MYESFYKLRSEPFRLSPDHRFCFRHQSYTRAMAYMRYAFERAEGFVMITGRPGTGKTTLVNDLIDNLTSSKVTVAMLVSTQMEADDLLRMVAYSFGLERDIRDKSAVLQGITRMLRSYHGAGRRALLIIDEAQDLSATALEELRLLTNLQFESQPLLQIFLLGQEELLDLIHGPNMEQVHQRLVASCRLKALEEHETKAYIKHRLRQVGWRYDPAISEAVYRIIYTLSEGVPRRINMICSRLFLHGSVEGRHQIGVEDARLVVAELENEQLISSNAAAGLMFDAEDVYEEPEFPDAATAAHAPGVGRQVGERTGGQNSSRAPQRRKYGIAELSRRFQTVEVPGETSRRRVEPQGVGIVERDPSKIVEPSPAVVPPMAVRRGSKPASTSARPGEHSGRRRTPGKKVLKQRGGEVRSELLHPLAGLDNRRSSSRGRSRVISTVLVTIALLAAVLVSLVVYKPAVFDRVVRATAEWRNTLTVALPWEKAINSLPPGFLAEGRPVVTVGKIETASRSEGDNEAATGQRAGEPEGGAAVSGYVRDFEPAMAQKTKAQSSPRPLEASGGYVPARNEADIPIVANASPRELSDTKYADLESPPVPPVQIYFKFDSVELQPNFESSLRELAEKIERHPKTRLSIVGFADAVGNRVYNLGLSLRRAEAVSEFFQSLGIDPGRLTVEGMGVDVATADGVHGRNSKIGRIVEVSIIPSTE